MQFTTRLDNRAIKRSCFKEQRYKILDAIHNQFLMAWIKSFVVSKSKDTRFQMQFTTFHGKCVLIGGRFKEQRYKILDAIQNSRFFIIKRCFFFINQCHFFKKQHSKIGCPILFRTAFCFGGRKKEVSRKSRKTSLNRAVARFRGGQRKVFLGFECFG